MNPATLLTKRDSGDTFVPFAQCIAPVPHIGEVIVDRDKVLAQDVLSSRIDAGQLARTSSNDVTTSGSKYVSVHVTKAVFLGDNASCNILGRGVSLYFGDLDAGQAFLQGFTLKKFP